METKGKAVDSVIQYQLHRKSEGGGGSEDSNEYIVHPVLVEPEGSDNYVRLDKTYLEIKEAIDNGKRIVFIDDNNVIYNHRGISDIDSNIYMSSYLFWTGENTFEPSIKARLEFSAYLSDFDLKFTTLTSSEDNYMIWDYYIG